MKLSLRILGHAAVVLTLALCLPAWGVNPLDPNSFTSLGSFNPSANVVVNTAGPTPTMTSGATVINGVISNPGGGATNIAVFTFSSFTLGAGLNLTATGPNCLAILSQGTMTINGTVSVNGSGSTAGVGGGNGRNQGLANSGGGNGFGPGGGPGNGNGGYGGGFGGAGGTTPSGGAGGLVNGNLSTALAGGSGGGQSTYDFGGAPGGGGGGALELGSIGAMTLGGTSSLQANGANGTAVANDDSGGGGSGGGILIHSAIGVTASGTVSANGGKGGDNIGGPYYGGGGGGGGRVRIERLVVPSAGTVTVAAGAGGINGSGGGPFPGAVGVSQSTAAPTFTAATGGNPISADTFPATFTTLTGPIYKEGVAGDVSTGTIILNAPAGFQFDTGGTAPTVLITGSATATDNINDVATGSSLAMTSVTASQITFTVTAATVVANTLTWQNVRVRPSQGRPLATGRITKTGTSTMFAITGGLPAAPTATSFGTLNEVQGAAAALSITAQPPGAAVARVPFSQPSVVSVVDQFGNLVFTDSGRNIKAIRNAGSGTLQGTVTVSTFGGFATFSNLSHDTASLISIDFDDISGPLPTVTSDPVIVMDPGDNRGTDFWLAFPGNINPASARLTLGIAADVATTGTVAIPGLSFVANFSLAAGGSTNIPLPATASINSSDTVETKGVHVVSTQKVRVFAFNMVNTSSDGFMALPVDRLGPDYIALGYNNGGSVLGSQFTIVATVNGTAVTITPATTTGARTTGVPYVVNLNAGQTYQLRNVTNSSTADLSRSTISATQPIAVMGGHLAASVPSTFGSGDHIVQQLLPMQAWGRNHLTTPYSTRSGYTVRVIAGAIATAVQTNGVALATLNLGEMREFILTNAATITANKPIQVAQYMHGSKYDKVNNSDPAMIIVPPSEQFTFDYTLPVQAGFTSYLNLTVPTAALNSVRLAGAAVSSTNFTAIGASGYSYARLPVTAGFRRVTASQPFGVFAYGFASVEGYGYAGGTDLGEIANVASVTVTPTGVSRTFGAQHLVTATVLNWGPLSGVRVDFVVTGANSRRGFNFTDASGQASFAYNGTNSVPGSDTITATAGSLNGSATVSWGPPTAPLIAGPASVSAEATSSAGASVALSAQVTQSNGQALTAKWYVDGILVFTEVAGAAFPAVTTLNTSLSVLYGLGSHAVTIVATDTTVNTSSYATTVTVVDNTAPTLTLNGVNPLTQLINTAFTDPGATASDIYAGNLTGSITVTGTVDTSKVGSYLRRYSVVDQSGNSRSLTRVVVVVDPTAPLAAVRADCHGTNFWLALPGNINATPELSLLITSDLSTYGTVTIPSLGFTNDFTVAAGALTTVVLPAGAAMDSSDLVETKGIKVNSADEVTVYGFNRVSSSADGFLALPDDALGKNYRVLSYHNGGPVPGSQFTIVASETGTTTATITPSTTTGARTVAVPYNVLLTQGQTYQLRNDTNSVTADLSGTLIAADKRIGVYGGHRAANTPNGTGTAGFAVEQLFPIETLGMKYVLQPFGGRTGYTMRVQATVNATAVSTNGVVFTNLVNSGDVAELVVTNGMLLTADKPVQVAQHAHGSSFEPVTKGDPFMLLISPYEQWVKDYAITTPATGYTNYVNITVTNAGTTTVRLDGVLVPGASFTAIGTSGFSGASVPITSGAHTLASSYPFGVGVYGHASGEAYGYLACSGAGLVANVTSVVLTPAGASTTIGSGRAFLATVRDVSNNPVAGVRVDFSISGLTTSNLFGWTDVNGQAGFNYVYTNNAAPGVDTIRASVGATLTSTTHTWLNNGAPAIVISGTTAPVVGPVPATFEATGPTGRSVTLNVNFGDPNGDNLVGNWYLDGTVSQAFLLAAGGPPNAGNNSFTATYSVGLHTVATVVADNTTSVTNTTTILIRDTTAPTLALVGANPLAWALNTPFVDPGATASDTVAGSLTSSITVTGSVNVNQAGSYQLTYSVSDPSGNIATTTRAVQVGGGPFSSTQPDSAGKVFALAFPGNIAVTPELSLLITSPVTTFGTVTVPGLGFTTNFAVTAGQVVTVLIPVTASVDSSDLVEAKGVFVTAADDVTVFGVNRVTTSTDSYLALPQDSLGTAYTVLGYRNGGVIRGSQFTVVATVNGTVVTITPTTTTGTRTTGVPYNVTLNAGETYQLRNQTNSTAADLSGTSITATQPIAVFGGHRAANIPYTFGSADYIVEQLPPNPTWGKSFVTTPLATRTGSSFRFQASASGAGVFTNGVLYTNLTAGQFSELVLTNATRITASNPILVAQYAHGAKYDNVPAGDPFMLLVPCYEQWLGDYSVVALSGSYASYMNLVVTNAAVGAITLNGVSIPAGDYVAIGTSGFSYATVPVSAGAYRLTGPIPFGVTVYGFAVTEGYGHPGGMNLAAVANVTTVALSQTVNTTSIGVSTTHTVKATVNGNLAGVRVDFKISGLNSLIGFNYTDALGVATFTYTNLGVPPGSDSIKASVGTVIGAPVLTHNWTP